MDDPERLGHTRQTLGSYLQSLAEWRRDKSRDREWDTKNNCYAESLEAVAAYIRSLPDSDPTLQRLADAPIDSLGFDNRFSDSHNQAVHCGPRGRVIAAAEIPAWFAAWGDTVIADSAHAYGEDPIA